ncbi:dihydrodipicolinate synthase family protein (plasmid) [Glaciihabitans sp. INWT7]|uniref:dihydrodipicolinate synthase family protein n=1 Tax=Glaciihabitans sp. INWT7 TaxID=2596912 RepID=UPI00162A629E|nr:dihydrodipicolinate synthase family protein [Glaciihabitans sp. INWT7]QNE48628.1 dihydrodipicolinate synthase family protein [Glaciihabitans sp. INWT7]
MTSITLLAADGTLSSAELMEAPAFARPAVPLASRMVFAAAHVVPHAWGANTPGQPAAIDWDATLAVRRHVWSWGLGVADAMDTAQRNMGLDWAATAALIRRSAAEAREVGGTLVVGVNTDHVAEEYISLDAVVAAYLLQLEVAEAAGAGVVMMASRHLARAAETAADYERVYREVLSQAGAPVVLHWLGEAFDESLAGYFGSRDVAVASDVVIRTIEENHDQVSGIKMSLLNADAEIAMRRRLPAGVRMFTGDDFNYVGLIEGDERGHSDALLGAFAAIAPNASASLQALDRGDLVGYRRILEPTEALARQVFATPTQYYKTGVAFLSWLNGHQSSFSMVGGLHSARDLPHLSEIVRLANASGALERPDLAAERWNGMLALNGLLALSSVQA